MSTKAWRELSPAGPPDEAWYLPMSATRRKLEVIAKLHH
jgi:hypothetical protein